MLLVKTSVRLSQIHGLGLFAAEPIHKGKAVWVYHAKIDSKIQKGEYEKFSESRRATVSHFARRNQQMQWILCGDGALFYNHSDAPNCEMQFLDDEFPDANDGVARTLREIKVGEELTLNYLE